MIDPLIDSTRTAEDVLEDLAALIENARSVPFSASCFLNRAVVLGLVDEVRNLLPEELAASRAVLYSRADILEDGRREAMRLSEAARAEQAVLVSEHEVTRTAIEQSAAIRAEVFEECDRRRRETDAYISAKLTVFEDSLSKTLDAVHRGRDRLKDVDGSRGSKISGLVGLDSRETQVHGFRATA